MMKQRRRSFSCSSAAGVASLCCKLLLMVVLVLAVVVCTLQLPHTASAGRSLVYRVPSPIPNDEIHNDNLIGT
ncbi:hypothetical protein GUJ93_ZPchr0009g1390 [Zizania palustris]|uniref:Uncharacterized protein n=1 Tax=Zizania palustris TaxID=103762 RepID=A0A8J5RQC9_ZIZPA|nr:hypothetical protein GUJ93_ZPchr0009g1390 [Zizania palustris]